MACSFALTKKPCVANLIECLCNIQKFCRALSPNFKITICLIIIKPRKQIPNMEYGHCYKFDL